MVSRIGECPFGGPYSPPVAPRLTVLLREVYETDPLRGNGAGVIVLHVSCGEGSIAAGEEHMTLAPIFS